MRFADHVAESDTRGVTDLNDGSLRGVRVCVVGINYAPEPTGSAPYTAGLAEMLLEHGAEVSVIAGVPHYPSWQVDPAYRRTLRVREELNGVQVVRARHFVPRRQSALSRLLWDATFLANAGLVRVTPKPDLVIASTPSLSGAVVGSRLARRHGVPFGLVVQDLVGQAAKQSGLRGGSSVAAAAARVEGQALRSADAVAVVSDAFRQQVDEYGVPAGRVRLMRNWTHVSGANLDRAEVRRQLGWSEDQFVVLHTGNMGLKQDLGNVVEAARRLAGRRDVLVVLMGDGNQRAMLAEAGQGIDVLQIVPPADGDLYPDVLRAADVLLVNERPSVGDMSLPSKLTSYFAAGRPVLAAVSDDGACARELGAAAGAAVQVAPGDPAALADAIATLADDRSGLPAMGAAGADYAERVLGRGAASRTALDLADLLLSSSSRPVARS